MEMINPADRGCEFPRGRVERATDVDWRIIERDYVTLRKIAESPGVEMGGLRLHAHASYQSLRNCDDMEINIIFF